MRDARISLCNFGAQYRLALPPPPLPSKIYSNLTPHRTYLSRPATPIESHFIDTYGTPAEIKPYKKQPAEQQN